MSKAAARFPVKRVGLALALGLAAMPGLANPPETAEPAEHAAMPAAAPACGWGSWRPWLRTGAVFLLAAAAAPSGAGLAPPPGQDGPGEWFAPSTWLHSDLSADDPVGRTLASTVHGVLAKVNASGELPPLTELRETLAAGGATLLSTLPDAPLDEEEPLRDILDRMSGTQVKTLLDTENHLGQELFGGAARFAADRPQAAAALQAAGMGMWAKAFATGSLIRELKTRSLDAVQGHLAALMAGGSPSLHPAGPPVLDWPRVLAEYRMKAQLRAETDATLKARIRQVPDPGVQALAARRLAQALKRSPGPLGLEGTEPMAAETLASLGAPQRSQLSALLRRLGLRLLEAAPRLPDDPARAEFLDFAGFNLLQDAQAAGALAHGSGAPLGALPEIPGPFRPEPQALYGIWEQVAQGLEDPLHLLRFHPASVTRFEAPRGSLAMTISRLDVPVAGAFMLADEDERGLGSMQVTLPQPEEAPGMTYRFRRVQGPEPGSTLDLLEETVPEGRTFIKVLETSN